MSFFYTPFQPVVSLDEVIDHEDDLKRRQEAYGGLRMSVQDGWDKLERVKKIVCMVIDGYI